MAVYNYRALDKSAALIHGTVVADSPKQARDFLRAKGLTPQQLQSQEVRAKASSRGGPSLFGFGSRHRSQVILFIRDVSTLLATGIPLLQAIDTTIRAQGQGSFKTALLLLRERLAAGSSLAEAMRAQPKIFDELCISAVEVGENAGTLESSLQNIADFKERSQQLKGRILSAVLYPLIVLVMGIGVSIFMMTFVVPALLEVLVESGRPLPLTTQLVKAVSDFLLNGWWTLVVGMLILLLSAKWFLRSERRLLACHALILRLPLLGELIRKQAIVRIALVISTLMRSGVPFVKAAEIAQRITPNRVLHRALGDCRQAVTAGRDIGVALESTAAFSPTVVQIFKVGQQSGRLEEMLERLAFDYDRQVNTVANRLTLVLEPILIIALATIVGLIAFATIMPILEAGDVL